MCFGGRLERTRMLSNMGSGAWVDNDDIIVEVCGDAIEILLGRASVMTFTGGHDSPIA